jgi:hypothetical protein
MPVPTLPHETPRALPPVEPGETMRVLRTPSADWLEAEMARYEKGDRHGKPQLYLPQTVLGYHLQADGLVRIPESAQYTHVFGDGGTDVVPLWHIAVQDLGCTDVTERPPAVPLPGPKPYKERERARMAAMLAQQQHVYILPPGATVPTPTAPPAPAAAS